MEKGVLDRRLAQMEAEGVTFVCSTSVGGTPPGHPRRRDEPEPGQERGAGTACAPDVTVRPAAEVQAAFDAVVLAGGATLPRDLPVPGRELGGVHLAMEYLKPSNLVQEGGLPRRPSTPRASASSSSGAATPGPTAWARRTARARRSVHQLEIMAEPPSDRLADNPWPVWPLILRTSSAHEEGGERLFSVTTTEFVDDGREPSRALRGHTVEMRTEDGHPVFEDVAGHRIRDRVRSGPAGHGLRRDRAPQRGRGARRERSPRGTVVADRDWSTSVEGCSCAATRPGARASSSGPSPRGARARRRSTVAHGHDVAAGADRAGPAGHPLSRCRR